jgi:hypothetical protein
MMDDADALCAIGGAAELGHTHEAKSDGGSLIVADGALLH